MQILNQCNVGYLRGHRTFPLTLTLMGPLNLVDTKLQEMKV